MQHRSQLNFRRSASLAVAAVMAVVTTGAASATEWRALAGAQSPDLGSQALAFLPNELWIHAGDSIRWTHASAEIHTVTFLTPGQVRPPNSGPTFGVPVGCPGNTPDGAGFNGSSCVNSGILGQGPVNLGPVIQTYSVSFPSTGNFKLVCLVHTDMTGTIHVLDPAAQLPHDQEFYDAEAARQGAILAAETSSRGRLSHSEDDDAGNPPQVTAGQGAIVATGARFADIGVDALSAGCAGCARGRHGGVDEPRSNYASHRHIRNRTGRPAPSFSECELDVRWRAANDHQLHQRQRQLRAFTSHSTGSARSGPVAAGRNAFSCHLHRSRHLQLHLLSS